MIFHMSSMSMALLKMSSDSKKYTHTQSRSISQMYKLILVMDTECLGFDLAAFIRCHIYIFIYLTFRILNESAYMPFAQTAWYVH